MLWNGKTLVKGKKFINDRKTGSPITTIQIYNARDVDEIFFLNISPYKRVDKSFYSELTSHCNVPITIGGGIESIKSISDLLECGADKISINSAAFSKKNLIESAAKYFGSQTIVVSLDYKMIKNIPYCFTHLGKKNQKFNLHDACKEMENRGAGEIVINNIDCDGLMEGYDCKTLKKINKIINIPLLISGGAGKLSHFSEAFSCGAQGACASSIFIFTQITPTEIKKYLLKKNINVRKPHQI